MSDPSLDQARLAYQRRDWRGALEGFQRARADADLAIDDLAALADAAWWLGENDEALSGFESVYGMLRANGEEARAARLGLELGFLWMLRGEAALASGWWGRARRLLDEQPECVEHGYALAADAAQAIAASDLDEALALSHQVQATAARFHDPALAAIGQVREGIARIKQGAIETGMAILDEAMLAVVADKVPPEWAGNLYCDLMGVCHDLADIDRARQWTAATESWSRQFQSAVMFVGICRVHRCQLLQLEGKWERAKSEAELACVELADMNVQAAAESHYQVGEVQRLRGDLMAAESSFRKAHELGRHPQPGLALVRLVQGRREAAGMAIETALAASPTDPFVRVGLLRAQTEIALANRDLVKAESASHELETIAERFASSGFQTAASHARGTLLNARGNHEEAIPVLREAGRRWQQMDVPYEAARIRLQLASAHRALGDEDGFALEWEAAFTAFERLGAALDLTKAKEMATHPALPDGLSRREGEVLALVASGNTNREIADALFISDRTVARHLSNIFSKLGVSTRTAAAAYAFEHGLAVDGHN